jgi:hypothetical protein
MADLRTAPYLVLHLRNAFAASTAHYSIRYHLVVRGDKESKRTLAYLRSFISSPSVCVPSFCVTSTHTTTTEHIHPDIYSRREGAR